MTEQGGSTTGTGAPAASDRNSLTVGADGPTLLHDVHFLEQMAHFNRERVPERSPHAKGSGAFGVLEVTEDVSRYTKAALFQKGARTDMLARFSTVAGELGSPDTWRDPRGFGLTGGEANRIAGEDADHHRRDLHDAIEREEFPSWTLSVQVMPYADAAGYRFNPFDVTKILPHSDYPLIKVGTMTLNRNPENFFAQIEQAAFSPGSVVPGIGFSPDKMLLGRTFAYADAHRNRIGTNFHQLPVNRPQVPVNTHLFDGAMTFDHSGDQAVYAPNSIGRAYADTTGPAEDGWETDGEMVRSAYSLHAEDEDFGQAGTLVRDVWDAAQRAEFVENVTGHLLGGVTGDVLERAFEYWKNVDGETGRLIEQKVRAANSGA
jgi:catalase